jgi:hypothetical protein
LDKNHHIALDAHYQTKFEINFWCGIHGSAVVGHAFLDNKSTVDPYHQFLETVTALLRCNGPHVMPSVLLAAGSAQGELWNGQHIHQISLYWTFFLWGHLKSVVYNNQP